MKKNSITKLFLFNVFLSSSSLADVYVGAGVGYSMLDNACFVSQSCDEQNITGNLHLGYKFNDYFSTEFNTDYLGEFTVNHSNENIVSAKDINLWGLSLAPKITLPINQALGIYGKIGGSYLVAGDESDIVPTASLGAELKINDSSALQIEYQRFQSMTSHFVDNMDVNLVSLRLSYQFGANDVLDYDKTDGQSLLESRPVTKIISKSMPQQSVSVLFDSDNTQSIVNDQLSSTIEVLIQHPDSLVEIKGHTDSTGSAEYNQKLSVQRAQFIADLISSEDIKNERITIIGMGESQPVADNITAQGRQENRRVEITIPTFEYNETVIENID